MHTIQFIDNQMAVDVVDEQGTIIMRAYDQGQNTALCRAPTEKEPERLVGQLAYVGRDEVQVSAPGSPLSLRKGNFLSRVYHVDGPGYSWTWTRALQEHYSLTDSSSGVTIAKYSRGKFSHKSVLHLEQEVNDQQLEAVVLTAMAMTEKRDLQKRKIVKSTVINAAI